MSSSWPARPWRGVRSSWLIWETKASLAWSAWMACSFARRERRMWPTFSTKDLSEGSRRTPSSQEIMMRRAS